MLAFSSTYCPACERMKPVLADVERACDEADAHVDVDRANGWLRVTKCRRYRRSSPSMQMVARSPVSSGCNRGTSSSARSKRSAACAARRVRPRQVRRRSEATGGSRPATQRLLHERRRGHARRAHTVAVHTAAHRERVGGCVFEVAAVDAHAWRSEKSFFARTSVITDGDELNPHGDAEAVRDGTNPIRPSAPRSDIPRSRGISTFRGVAGLIATDPRARRTPTPRVTLPASSRAPPGRRPRSARDGLRPRRLQGARRRRRRPP